MSYYFDNDKKCLDVRDVSGSITIFTDGILLIKTTFSNNLQVIINSNKTEKRCYDDSPNENARCIKINNNKNSIQINENVFSSQNLDSGSNIDIDDVKDEEFL